MYFLKSLEESIKLHPSWFHGGAQDIVRKKLYLNVEGKNLGNHHVIAVVSIDDISEPMIQSGTGYALYTVSYRALVWRPFRGEVVDGLVKSVLQTGIFIEVGGLDIFVSRSVGFSTLSRADWVACGFWRLKGEYGRLILGIADDAARLQVQRRGLDTQLHRCRRRHQHRARH